MQICASVVYSLSFSFLLLFKHFALHLSLVLFHSCVCSYCSRSVSNSVSSPWYLPSLSLFAVLQCRCVAIRLTVRSTALHDNYMASILYCSLQEQYTGFQREHHGRLPRLHCPRVFSLTSAVSITWNPLVSCSIIRVGWSCATLMATIFSYKGQDREKEGKTGRESLRGVERSIERDSQRKTENRDRQRDRETHGMQRDTEIDLETQWATQRKADAAPHAEPTHSQTDKEINADTLTHTQSDTSRKRIENSATSSPTNTFQATMPPWLPCVIKRCLTTLLSHCLGRLSCATFPHGSTPRASTSTSVICGWKTGRGGGKEDE